jgi:hypothetical protein
VVERVSEWQPTGAGLYLPGNAVRALGKLGIGSAVAARANPIRRQRLLDHNGRRLAEIDVDRLWEGVGGCVAIERAVLHETLLEATVDVPVRLGTSVTGLEVGQVPTVAFVDGSTESYDLVVGADGVHSTIRRLAMGGRPARYVGQASWRFIAGGFPGISDWTVMLARGRAFLTVALGRGAVYCYADVDTTDPAAVNGEAWRDSFADLADPVPSLLEQATEAYFAPIEEVVPPAFAARGVALAETLRTPAHRTWLRAQRWRLRTPSSSLSCSAGANPSRRCSPVMNSNAAREWGLCKSKPIAATARGACRPSSATSPCAWPLNVVSAPTTGRCEPCRTPRYCQGVQRRPWLLAVHTDARRRRRPRISRAALRPGVPMTPPPGWAAAPHRYRPPIGVR